MWTFAPSDRTTYNLSATCHYGSIRPALLKALGSQPASDLTQHTAALVDKIDQESDLSNTLSVNLVGQGTVGALTLQPTSIDFGTVSVGYPVKRSITLLNQSGGNLRYSITCRPAVLTANLPGSAQDTATSSALSNDTSSAGLPTSVQLQSSTLSTDKALAHHIAIQEPQGVLAARATRTLSVTLTPTHRTQYALQLVCETATENALPSNTLDTACTTAVATSAVPTSLCAPAVVASIAAFSTYPTLVITDVACQGFDKPFAWRQMSCSQINRELADELNQVSTVSQNANHPAVP